jgi:uncharacterized membrane protein YqhA
MRDRYVSVTIRRNNGKEAKRMTKVFGLSRYLVLIAVIGLLLAAVAVIIFAGIATVNIIIETFAEGEYTAEGARTASVEFIEMIDTFLLGTVLLITSVGLYQLFIEPNMELPEWLVVTNLEQLKFNLLAVIVVMLAILFLGEAAGELAKSNGILGYGLAIAAVLAAVALVVWTFQRVTSVEEEHVHEIVEKAHKEVHDKVTSEGEG